MEPDADSLTALSFLRCVLNDRRGQVCCTRLLMERRVLAEAGPPWGAGEQGLGRGRGTADERGARSFSPRLGPAQHCLEDSLVHLHSEP